MFWIPSSLPALALAAFLLVFAGVVLPAVWSIRPARRHAAAAVLAQLLAALPGARQEPAAVFGRRAPHANAGE